MTADLLVRAMTFGRAGYETGAFRRAIGLLISFVLLLVGMAVFATARAGQTIAEQPLQELREPTPRALLRAAANRCVVPPRVVRGVSASSLQEDETSAFVPESDAALAGDARIAAPFASRRGGEKAVPDIALLFCAHAYASRAPPVLALV